MYNCFKFCSIRCLRLRSANIGLRAASEVWAEQYTVESSLLLYYCCHCYYYYYVVVHDNYCTTIYKQAGSRSRPRFYGCTSTVVSSGHATRTTKNSLQRAVFYGPLAWWPLAKTRNESKYSIDVSAYPEFRTLLSITTINTIMRSHMGPQPHSPRAQGRSARGWSGLSCMTVTTCFTCVFFWPTTKSHDPYPSPYNLYARYPGKSSQESAIGTKAGEARQLGLNR